MARKVFIGQKEKSHINTGGQDVGTTVVALSTNDRPLKGGVQVIADAGNSGIVYIGVRSTLTAGTVNATDGFPLSSGESIFVPVSTEADLKLVADAASQAVHFISF